MSKQSGRSIAATGIGWAIGTLATAAISPAWPVILLASLAVAGYGLGRGGDSE